MTLTAIPSPQAWLAKEVVGFGPCLVRLGGERSTFGAIQRGHWVVVVDADGALERVGQDAATVSVSFQPIPGHVMVDEGTGIWKKDLSTEKRKLINRLVGMLIDGETWNLGEFDILAPSGETQ